ncbi:hypothetical protein [Nonomuraea guangzhouensis]|uniref:Uncharacterized protein n=1 Tax=Nonomuraea guangzhouensis TaxID=1291555 RepID=A0ABW4GAL9_9ACTN|nr:hypothetical protein [Nonomuraea guangzhouensis]
MELSIGGYYLINTFTISYVVDELLVMGYQSTRIQPRRLVFILAGLMAL